MALVLTVRRFADRHRRGQGVTHGSFALMAVVKGELSFAPGIRMRDLNLDNASETLDAFERRVYGLFLAPIHVTETTAESEEGRLFACALLVAALIESLARVETGSDDQGTLIKQWLEAHIPEFRKSISMKGDSRSPTSSNTGSSTV